MSEHETTPPAEPSDKAQPPASPWQAPAASGQPDPATGRSSTDWTPTNQPYAGSPAPAQPAPNSPAAEAPASAQPASEAPASAQPASEAPASAQPASAQPVTGPPLGGQPQAGPYAPGYAQVPYGPGQHGQWSHGQPYAGHGYSQPHVSWSPPPGAAAQAGAQRPPNRVGRIVAGSAVVLALMLGSGAVGGAVVAAFDNGSAAPAVQTGSNGGGSAAPVIDRSSLAEIADAVQDSVVSISTGSGEGSGVVLNAEGFILTNNHVVESARGGSVTVYFADGGSASGSVVGTDARTDLAVVKVDDVDGLSPATLGDSSTMRVGDTVLALGSPLGLQGSVTAGIISAQDRTISVGGGQQQSPFGGGGQVSSMSGLLQTDAPINPGNSGGALVNTNGEVIGINTAIATSGQGEGNIGVGFAIPSNKAKDVAEALMAGEEVSHPYLGVSVTAADGGGALIAAVEDGSPADQAGLAQGDVVVQIGDTPVNDSDDLVAAVQSGQVGEQIEITYERDGEARTASATLVDAP
ncbi:trypsin-like peptidase domain-containing protein [Solwaraspora sp. WMMD792]|uniref:trypsin-like peptidase domain-containing protein n=1 Tax=Solwaraspora sp. WMMD792 TaxID=3016099 RepID=UPI002417C138|nr:trypsin-like peptidase domain-containing protein [Solwaraspora sp. WMMD792]MDG4769287.1 trypsin-like peptidase domain-containing protein [Solwaraspora sp. WMMD792]